MNALLAVVRREAHEKAFVLAGALAASFLPIVIPLIPGLAKLPGQDVREISAGLVSCGLAGLLAVVFGATAFPLSASDRRMGFDFTRPVPAWALWLGKMGVAAGFVAVCGLVIVTPSWIVESVRVGVPMGTIRGVGSLWPLLLLIPAAHVGSVVIRSRSRWLLADFAFVVVVVQAWAYLFSRMLRLGLGSDVATLSAQIWGISIAAGVTLASLSAVVRGRMDIRRAQRAVSLALWACLIAGVIGMAGHWRWVKTPNPEDAERFQYLLPAPAGPWMSFSSPCRGSYLGFVYNGETGEFLRTGPNALAFPAISASGSVVAWFEAVRGGGQLLSADLGLAKPRKIRTAVFLDDRPEFCRLSPAATRLASWTAGGRFEVHDVHSGEALVRQRRVETDPGYHIHFLGEDRIRLVGFEPGGDDRGRLEIQEFEAVAGVLATTGAIDGIRAERRPKLVFDERAERMLLVEYLETRITLRDGATGRELARLLELPPGTRCGAGFLADGRIVVAFEDDDATRLNLHSADGSPLNRISVPGTGGRMLVPGAEVAPGRFILGFKPASRPGEEALAFLVDADSGSVAGIPGDLLPAASIRWSVRFVVRNPPVAVGLPASRLFTNASYTSLVRLDAETGEQEVLLGRGRAR